MDAILKVPPIGLEEQPDVVLFSLHDLVLLVMGRFDRVRSTSRAHKRSDRGPNGIQEKEEFFSSRLGEAGHVLVTGGETNRELAVVVRGRRVEPILGEVGSLVFEKLAENRAMATVFVFAIAPYGEVRP